MTENSQVLAYAKRIAALEGQKANITSDISDIKIEAKQQGYDASLIGKIAKLMNMEEEKKSRALEQHDLFDTYIDQAGIR